MDVDAEHQVGLSGAQFRVLGAGVLAFVLPGLFVGLIGAALYPRDVFPEGGSLTLWTWALSVLGLSSAGALFGSPIIILDLVIWHVMVRLKMLRAWLFLAVGAVSGLIFPALLLLPGVVPRGATTRFTTVFALAGAATGLFVWLTAYWVPTSRARRR